MATGRLKLVRGALGVALLAGSAGILGGLGVGVAGEGVASAAGPTVSGTYSCSTPLGTKKVPAAIHDLNTIPSSLHRGSTYTAKPLMVANIPKSLIHTAHTATPSLTSLPVSEATLSVVKVGFSGTNQFAATLKPTLTTNAAIVPINATTLTHGYTATITYNAVTFTVTATSGKATLTPGTLKLHVLVSLSCYPPSQAIVYNTPTTFTQGYNVVGSNTLGPIDSTTALAGPAPPTITKVTPSSGPLGGGTTVTLTGSGFISGATSVTFGGTNIAAGSVTFVTATKIRVTSPSHGAGNVTVKATTVGGTSGSGEHFTYVTAPTVTKVTPNAGPTSGGTTVTITGTNFITGATSVTFGGTTIPAGSVTFVSTTQLKVSSPAHGAATVTVKATTVGGTSGAGQHFIFGSAPSITRVTPSAGPTAGGTTVTLTGSGFLTGATTVTFGGTRIPAGSVTFVSSSQISVSSPSHAAGTVTVKATTTIGTSGSGEHFTYEAVPTITKVTPSAGPTAGGTTVTLTGTNFVSGATSVTFGGTTIPAGSVTFVNASKIRVTSPAHGAATVTVKATTAGGTSGAGEHFTYEAVPTITAVTPSAGPTGGGTTVTLTGSGFLTGATTVTFGGTNIAAGSVTFVSTTQIKVTSPAHGAGTVTVKATTAGGTSGAGEHFTYEAAPTITKVTPNSGPTAGGTVVTLTGTNFVTGATTVTFGGTVIPAGSVTFVNATSIKVNVPSGSAAGTVTVKAITAGGTSAAGQHFTYENAPTISSVTPSAGPTAGGTTVTLNGTNFVSGATTVTFGGTTIPAGSVTFVSTSKIKVTSPAHAAGAVTVTATTAGGTSGSGEHFTYEAAPTITRVSPGAGPTAGGTAVTLTGSNFVTGATTVTFGGTTIPAGSVTFVSTTQITVSSPAHATGTVTVRATTAGGTSGPGEAFSYGAPTITQITPAAGPTAGGTTVTLLGHGFVTGATTVTFGGTPIAAGSVTFVSTTQIKVTSPAHAAGSVTVTATTAGGTSASQHFTYGGPAITSFTPTGGPSTGGTTVTINGSGFTGATAVHFGNKTAASFHVTSATKITAVTKAHPLGPVAVTVTTAGGTATAAASFTYETPPTVTSFTPVIGTAAGGTAVYITGTGFVTGATTVKFGTTTAASVTVTNTTNLIAVTKAHPVGTVQITVRTIGGSATSISSFTFLPVPTISAITPVAGPTAGGTTVTITGTAFVTGVTSVKFGATTARSWTVTSPTKITAVTEAHATATVTVTVNVAGGISNGKHYAFDPVPTLSAVTPAAGKLAGGTTVTLTGTGFRSGATTVTFGPANPGTTVHVTGTTTLTVVTPAHTTGTVTVTVATPGGSSHTVPYTYDPIPTLSSVTPISGKLVGGTHVTLTGTGFRSGATTVTFGSGNHGTTVHVTGPTSLTVVSPAHTAGTVTVTVTTPGGTSGSKHFTYEPIPTLTSITPTAGKLVGGTTVTLTGTGFVTGFTSVKFGTTIARSWTVTSPTTIVAVSPAHGVGTVTVTVTTPGGTSNGETYAYDPIPTLSSVTPIAGKLVGGTTVTITGTGFRTGATAVTFGSGNHGTSVVVSGTTTLTVLSPPHATATVTVTVTTPGGTSNALTYAFDPIPTLSTVAPTAGKLVGGTTVTLTGTGFRTGATTVTFGLGNLGTTVVVAGTTSLTVKTPAHATATVTVTVTTPGGTSGTKHYAYDPIPTLSSVTPTAGKVAGGTTVTLTGTGFRTGLTSVTFGSGNHGTTVHVSGTTSLTVKTPGHSVATVTVTVTTPGGTSGTEHYTYDPIPTITSLTPIAGKVAGGTVVTVTGTGFRTGATAVTFGSGNHGLTVHVTGTTTLTVKTPAHSTANVTVTVTTPGGTSGSKPYAYDPIPTLSAVAPTAGKLVGGTTVTLTGSGFRTGATTVTFGSGNHGVTVHVTGTTSLTVKTPAHATATVTVTVTTPGGTSGAQHYAYRMIPTLTAITPVAGKLAGGTTITLTGSNFVTGAVVTFGAGNHGTTLHIVGTTSLTVKAPAHATATVTVTVTTPGGTSGAKHYAYDPIPTLTAITPVAGKLVGGTTVTLTGSGFRTGATTVTFGAGNHGTTVHVTSTTSLTVKSAAHAAGTVTVSVTTPGGSSGFKTYTYDAGPTITSLSSRTGSINGGARFNITGTNFVSVQHVKFGTTTAASFTVTSSVKIVVTSPAHAAGTVHINVTTPGGTTPTTTTNKYKYLSPAPTVTSISPVAGTPSGGTTVTVNGSNFLGTTKVKFGTRTGTTISVNAGGTQLTVKSPSGTQGTTVNVRVTTPGGTSAIVTADQFTYGPVITSMSRTGGTHLGGTRFSITGKGFVTVQHVKFGTTTATSFTVKSATVITVTSPAHAVGTVRVSVITAAGTTPATNADLYAYS